MRSLSNFIGVRTKYPTTVLVINFFYPSRSLQRESCMEILLNFSCYIDMNESEKTRKNESQEFDRIDGATTNVFNNISGQNYGETSRADRANRISFFL